MRIDGIDYQDVEIKVISKRLKPSFAGSRQIALYEATCKVKNKTKRKKSESMGELLEWIQKVKAA
ncbi:hypothetical protein [Turicimonas muris]|uniref:hypothetical protein n=1 Tax=Turicimonas muris TaxID=1796652 RepID=UPI0024952165|nr:hypothetical protein [Turicimonas muris]